MKKQANKQKEDFEFINYEMVETLNDFLLKPLCYCKYNFAKFKNDQ